MISGRRNSLFVATLVALTGFVVLAQDNVGFRELMDALASIDASQVTYSEIKYIGILDAPVEQSGLLSYEAPDTVVLEIHEPVQETYAIVGDTMRVATGGKEKHIRLDTVPLLRAFIEAFRATLSGNPELLNRHYMVEFSGDYEAWKLELRPLNKKLGGFVKSIGFSGTATQIDGIDIIEPNGDWSRMTLTAAPKNGTPETDGS